MKIGDDPELQRMAREMGVRPGGAARQQHGDRRRRRRGEGSQKGPPPECLKLPDELAFASFYGDDGRLRPEIFFSAGEGLARRLQGCGVSGKAFRTLYMSYKAIAKALLSGRTDMPGARERFGRFYVLRVVRQVERGVVHPIVRDLFDRHRDVILGDEGEFVGFLYYLEAAFCYFKPD